MFYVNKVTSDTVVDFAAEELKKYLRMMMPEGGDVKIAYAPDAKDGFRLGVMEDFGLDTSDAEDTELDDILYTDCDTEGGIIAGSNPRSVLLSVYEYLRRQGCRWLYPGVDGEFIPMQDVKPVKYRHKPTDRYRGNCIEGAITQSLLNDYIDFLPKVGLNAFLIQFMTPTAFYERYFNRTGIEEHKEKMPVTVNAVKQWNTVTECEMAKRGIQYHGVGHGWGAEAFGLDSASAWTPTDNDKIPDETRKYLAEINGVRGINRCVLGTNFCMSNPEARKKFVNYVADYSAKHSNVDYMHVWLADFSNNHCECENCRKKTPSDFYVILLNEIDGELTRRELKTRIVFISYVDTSWAPECEVIKNPSRFTLLIAPITRDYKKTLNGDEGPKLQPYVRNKLTMPKDLAEYLLYLEGWKKNYKGSCLCFDYHFWVHSHYDISGLRIAERLYEDVKLYRSRGIDGIIQCGTQRSFFPNGYAFYTHARAMFDGELSLEEITWDYFSHIYGERWQRFYDFLRSLDDAFPFEFFARARYSESIYDRERAEKIAKIPSLVSTVGRELIEEHYNSDVRVRTVSVRLLEKYLKYASLVADIASAKAMGHSDEAEEKFKVFVREFAKMEDEILPYADLFQNTLTVKQLLNCETPTDGAFVVG